MNKEKDNPQQQMQDLFSQMVSQTSGMFSPMDPLGAMKPFSRLLKPGPKIPAVCRRNAGLDSTDRGYEYPDLAGFSGSSKGK